MPRTMNRDAPEAFRLVVTRVRTYKGEETKTVHYFGPYATKAAAKGQVRAAMDWLRAYWSEDVFAAGIERTDSKWTAVEELLSA